MGYEDLLKIMLQIQQDCRKEERKSLLQEEVSPEVLFLQKIAGDEKPNEQEIFSSETTDPLSGKKNVLIEASASSTLCFARYITRLPFP